ncbi:MAG: hypothetical protein JSS29_08905 [Proteobacteria bacterium]|nr:hypothetical protein [Pseudomonadota bacterium]
MSLALAFAVAGLILLGCAVVVLVSIARVAEILPAALPAASESPPSAALRTPGSFRTDPSRH